MFDSQCPVVLGIIQLVACAVNVATVIIEWKALYVPDKLEILWKHDINTTLNQKQLADLLGIQSSTFRTIIKNRNSIIAVAKSGGC